MSDLSFYDRAKQSFPIAYLSRQRISELLNDYLDYIEDDTFARFSLGL